MQQEELFRAFETDSDLGNKILELIEKSVHKIGLKEFAYLIGKKPEQVRDALNQNNKYFSVTWLPTIIRHDPEGFTEVIKYLCDLSNKEHPKDKSTMTLEDRVKFYEEIIVKHGLQKLFSE